MSTALTSCRRSLLSSSSSSSSCPLSLSSTRHLFRSLSLHPPPSSSTHSHSILITCSLTIPTSHITSSHRTFATVATPTIAFELKEAIALARATAPSRFDETVEIAINLGVDPRKPNQSVRGAAMLPHGSGKSVRIAVFAKGEKAEEARKAGADIVGEADLAAKIQEGKIDFQRCISTPDMMAVVGRVARILGPRGLMPNPKLGTVTMNLTDAIKNAKKGQVEFRTEKAGIVHAPMGKLSFTDTALYENMESFIKTIIDAKPSGAKGLYIRKCTLSTTQGKGVPVDIRMYPFKIARAKSIEVTSPIVAPTSTSSPTPSASATA